MSLPFPPLRTFTGRPADSSLAWLEGYSGAQEKHPSRPNGPQLPSLPCRSQRRPVPVMGESWKPPGGVVGGREGRRGRRFSNRPLHVSLIIILFLKPRHECPNQLSQPRAAPARHSLPGAFGTEGHGEGRWDCLLYQASPVCPLTEVVQEP